MKVRGRPSRHKEKPARVGLFEVPLMHAIERGGDDACGSWIGEEMTERLGYYVPQAQVYSTIKRLVRRGLVRHCKTRTVRGSPPLKVYEVTPAGRRALDEATRQFSVAFDRKEKPHDRKEKSH